MRLRVVSDLHFEFHADWGHALLKEVTAGDFDVLIVAGDLTDSKGLVGALLRLKESTPKPIVYVLGNHEAYGTTIYNSVRIACAMGERSNLHVLEDDTVILGGRRFVGCTLWFFHDGIPEPDDHYMADFLAIKDFRHKVPSIGHESIKFLRRSVEPGDIVVTHHLPSPQSIDPRFARSSLNKYFVHDCSDIIKENKPALWVHGHTHCSMDYVQNSTRVLCNPHGYLGAGSPGEPNPNFNPQLTLEL